jgi:hypothetical protein
MLDQADVILAVQEAAGIEALSGMPDISARLAMLVKPRLPRLLMAIRARDREQLDSTEVIRLVKLVAQPEPLTPTFVPNDQPSLDKLAQAVELLTSMPTAEEVAARLHADPAVFWSRLEHAARWLGELAAIHARNVCCPVGSQRGRACEDETL